MICVHNALNLGDLAQDPTLPLNMDALTQTAKCDHLQAPFSFQDPVIKVGFQQPLGHPWPFVLYPHPHSFQFHPLSGMPFLLLFTGGLI